MNKPNDIPLLSEFPVVPDRNDPATYADRSEVWDEFQKQSMEPQLNSMSEGMNAAADYMQYSIDKVAADLAQTLAYRNDAEVFAGLQQYEGAWASGTYAIKDSVSHEGFFWINGVDGNTAKPTAENSGWSIIPKADFKPSINPTIDLDFANQAYSIYEAPGGLTKNKLITDILTVTHGSESCYTDPTGKLRTVAVDEPRINWNPETGECEGLLVEETRTNLFTHGRQLHLSKGINNKIIRWEGDLSRNNNGVKLIPTNNGAGHRYKIIYADTGLSNQITASVYIKFGGFDRVHLFTDALGTTEEGDFYGSNTYFSFLTESSSDSDVLKAEKLSNGVFKLSLTWTNIPSAGVEYRVSISCHEDGLDNINAVNANGFDGVIFLAGQVEQGSYSTSIIPDATIFNSRADPATYFDSTGILATAAIDESRYQYNPAYLSAEPYLLLEEERTNLVTYSNDFVNWSSQSSVILTTNDLEVFGVGFTKIASNSDSSNTLISDTLSSLPAGTYTYSVFVTGDEGVVLRYRSDDMSESVIARFSSTNGKFDLNTLTIVGTGLFSNVSHHAREVKSGIYQIWVTFDATAEIVNGRYEVWYRGYGVSSTTDGDLWIGLSQLEEGSYPTSYIPTTTAQVTRSADVSTGVQATRAVDGIYSDLTGDEFQNNSFAVLAEGYLNGFDYDEICALIDPYKSGYSASVLKCLANGSNKLYSSFNIDDQQVLQYKEEYFDPDVKQKAMLVVDGLDVRYYQNGALFQTGTLPYEFRPTRLRLSANARNSKSNIKVFPKALSDAEAIAITS